MSSQAPFRALADPTRREILRLLSQADMTVAQVSERFDMTRAAVKKHLIVLEEGGLITSHRKGRETINCLHAAGFAPVNDWLSFFEGYWDDKLAALGRALETKPTEKD